MGTEARRVATLIMFQILTMYLTLPINVLIADNFPTSHDTCYILFTTGSVLIKEQLRGACTAHSLEYLGEGVAAGKEQQQYGDIGLGGMLHTSSGMIKIEWIFCFSLGGISI